MARPVKDKAERRSSKTMIAWKEDEIAIINQAAAALGLNVAGFLRMASLDRAKEVLGLPRPPHRE